MRVYIAGPIHSPVGVSKEVLKARFGSMAYWLEAHRPDWEVVNPLDCLPGCEAEGMTQCQDRSGLPSGEGHSWECWMRGDLRHMLTCDALVLLPSWEQSNGASLEAEIAKRLYFGVYMAALVNPRVNVDGTLGWTLM